MLNSRDVDRLRTDVAANCKIFLERCLAQGLPVLVTGTVRDNAFQEDCYRRGTAKTRVPSFHAEHAGLAFDICKNVKGQEYSDSGFFARCGAIGREMGFEWGGDWKTFPDKPHFQWSDGGRYTSAMVRAKRYPPPMPLFNQEDEELTQEQFDKMMDIYLSRRGQRLCSEWAKAGLEQAAQRGITDASRPQAFATREEVAQMILNCIK